MTSSIDPAGAGGSLGAGAPAPAGHRIFTVGTLRYTTFGLVTLFFWLLWGDFFNSLLDTNVPSILPLKLNDLGADDATVVILNKTLAYAIIFVFAPIVSFHSDRHRGRWGRRIPYLAWATPFVGLFMVLIGCYGDVVNLLIGNAAHATLLGFEISRKTLTLLVFGALFVGFDFANIFVGTVYWYLFNDVVPQQFLSRFLALFRMVGIAAGMFYNKLIFPHALDHFRMIFVVGGIAYVVCFLLMCCFVREGQYPPPPPNLDCRKGFFSSARTFATECFTHRFYWFFFLTSTCFAMSSQSTVFQLLRNRNALGLTLEQLGDVAFYSAPLNFLLQYPIAWLADRHNPIRVFFVAVAVCAAINVLQCIYIFRDFGPSGNLVLLYGLTFLYVPFYTMMWAAEIPMFMRLLPKERYGQFSSANAMLRSFAMIFGSLLVGFFMNYLQTGLGMGDFRYRFYPVWTAFFQGLSLVFLVFLYREWKKRGGDKGYTPPMVAVPEVLPV